MAVGWEGGSTRAHRNARAQVLAAAGERCQLRLDGCTTIATEAHHTLGKTVTGDDPAFMVAACRSCNVRVGDPRADDPQPAVTPWW